MRLLRIWILAVTTFLLCGGMAVGAPVEQSISKDRDTVSPQQVVILYSQPPSLSGGLLQSSLRDPDGSDTDQWVWDGFTLASTLDITEVQWRGGYDPALGSGGPVFNFIVDIYASISAGTQPDLSQPPLVHYEVGGNANETPAEVLGGVQTYDYHYALPAPFQATAGTKYWIQIEAYQSGAPDWGLSKASEGDGYYFRTDGYIYQLVSGDAAFTLLGPSYGADLALSKVDALDPVIEGDDVTYTVTASNNGPETAQNVVLTDNLPGGVVFVSATPDQGSCGEAGGVVTCSLGDMANGGSTNVEIVVTTTAAGTITNNASVTSDTADPNGANNSASEQTEVHPAADLALSKVDALDPVLEGDDVTYTVTASNNGPETAQNVVLTDNLPAGVVFVSATPDQGNCGEASGVVTCSLGDMANGGSTNVEIVVTTTAAGTITNNASVTSDTADPNGANNSASEQTDVHPATGPVADLSIAKLDNPDPVNVGALLTYTLIITNAGPNQATAVTVTDTLPVEVTYGGASGADWNCTHLGWEVTCTHPSLGIGVAPTIEITVTAPANNGIITNTATVSSQEVDPDESNNLARITTRVWFFHYVYLPLVQK